MLAQRAEELAKPRQVAIGACTAPGELGKLGDPISVVIACQTAGKLGDPPLEPAALGFEGERLRIALGEHVLDGGTIGGRDAQQCLHAVDEHSGLVRHPTDYASRRR